MKTAFVYLCRGLVAFLAAALVGMTILTFIADWPDSLYGCMIAVGICAAITGAVALYFHCDETRNK